MKGKTEIETQEHKRMEISLLDQKIEIKKLQAEVLANTEGMTEREKNIKNLRDEAENLQIDIKHLTDTVVNSEKLIMNTSTQLEELKCIRMKVEGGM